MKGMGIAEKIVFCGIVTVGGWDSGLEKSGKPHRLYTV
jgi:hypothetical protein